MKITPEQLKAVQGLLPGYEIQEMTVPGYAPGDEGYYLDITALSNGKGHDTLDSEGAAIFCDLLKRAVLAKDEVVWVESTSFQKDAYVKIRVCDPLETIKTDLAPTELEAWILAVTELAGRLGK